MLAFFLISGIGFLAGATYAWSDEHGGSAGTAHVTDCTRGTGGYKTGRSVHCDATWNYNGRTVTGYVENANLKQERKTISVRIHGTSHVTNTTYWVPIGLALFGVFELAVFVMILRQYRQKAQGT
jgi:hypothetical protein